MPGGRGLLESLQCSIGESGKASGRRRRARRGPWSTDLREGRKRTMDARATGQVFSRRREQQEQGALR